MKIKDLFNPDVQEILTEESLTAIQEAFDTKVQHSVETALQEQDEKYAEKLTTLIKTIDKDHATKMTRILESNDRKVSSKFLKVVKNYERILNTEATNFKKVMIGAVSNYLEEFLHESFSKDEIATACKNKSAFKVLENLRSVLSVDGAMMKESVRGAIMDGKSQMTVLEKENQDLKKGFNALYEENQKLQVTQLLESKISGLSDTKKNFLKKTLQDKTVEFIEENFDYTLRLFDKQENAQRKVLKEQALENRTVKPDVVPEQKVIPEKVNNDEADDMYVSELSRVFGARKPISQ